MTKRLAVKATVIKTVTRVFYYDVTDKDPDRIEDLLNESYPDEREYLGWQEDDDALEVDHVEVNSEVCVVERMPYSPDPEEEAGS